jgi:hypothetical protein
LELVAPLELKKELQRAEGPNYYYYFGNVLCPIFSKFYKIDSYTLSGYYRRSEIPYLYAVYTGVERLRVELDKIIDTSAFLMEPVLLRQSYELLEDLNEITELKIKPEAVPDEIEIDVMVYSSTLAISVEKAIELINFLLAKATILNSIS